MQPAMTALHASVRQPVCLPVCARACLSAIAPHRRRLSGHDSNTCLAFTARIHCRPVHARHNPDTLAGGRVWYDSRAPAAILNPKPSIDTR